MATRSQYVLRETLISVAINTALSVAFVFLAFHGQSQIAATGHHGIVLDMIPQTFMVVLMSCLIPALLTRRRLSTGSLTWHKMEGAMSLQSISMRAAGVALLATVIVFAASWVALPRVFPMGLSFTSLLVSKALFGMLLAASATPWAIDRVLRPRAV